MSERDPELEKLYREHSREEPSSALDAAILAAAHRAVESGPRKVGEATRPQRWWMPLAAAAAIGVLAIGVIQQVPKETAIDATSISSTPMRDAVPPAAPQAQAPAPAPAAEPPAQAPATTAEKNAAPVDTGALAKKQKEADARANAPQVALAPAPSAAPAPPPPAATAPAPAPPRKAENKLAAEPTPFPAAPVEDKSAAASADGAAKRDAPMEQSASADRRKDESFREERQEAASKLAGSAAGAAPPPPAAPAPAPVPAPSARERATPSAPVSERARAPTPAAVQSFRGQSDELQGKIAQSPSQTKNADEELRILARDPDAWIVRIRKLRDEGNTAQALRELKEFRALVPDAERRLPADLRALQP